VLEGHPRAGKKNDGEVCRACPTRPTTIVSYKLCPAENEKLTCDRRDFFPRGAVVSDDQSMRGKKPRGSAGGRGERGEWEEFDGHLAEVTLQGKLRAEEKIVT